jgi:hypothetical protein
MLTGVIVSAKRHGASRSPPPAAPMSGASRRRGPSIQKSDGDCPKSALTVLCRAHTLHLAEAISPFTYYKSCSQTESLRLERQGTDSCRDKQNDRGVPEGVDPRAQQARAFECAPHIGAFVIRRSWQDFLRGVAFMLDSVRHLSDRRCTEDPRGAVQARRQPRTWVQRTAARGPSTGPVPNAAILLAN